MSLMGRLRNDVATEKGGIPVLRLWLEVVNRFEAKIQVISTDAEFRVGRSNRWENTRFIGQALVEAYGELSPGSQATWALSLPLTQHQLQKIEEIRNSSDLYVVAMIRFTAAVDRKST